MPSERSVHAVQHGPMRTATSDGEHEVTVDHPLPGGAGDLDPVCVERAPALSEEQTCPVWAMLKAGTPVSSSYTVVAG